MATAMTAATAQDRTGAGASRVRVRTRQDRPDAMQLVVMRRSHSLQAESVSEKD